MKKSNCFVKSLKPYSMQIKTFTSLVILLAFSLAISLGVARAKVSATEPKVTSPSEKKLIYCSEANPTVFSPQIAYDTSTFTVLRALYNRLIDFEHGTTKIIPSIAQSWIVSPDGRTILLQLRNDVRFHAMRGFQPTRVLNADDVIFTFERMSNNNHPLHNKSGGNYQYFRSLEMDKLIQSIEKIDDYKVKIKLTRPEAPILANLAMDFASIISKEYFEYLKSINKLEQFDSIPVGTGPFFFVQYNPNQSVLLRRHERYFLGPAAVHHLEFKIVTNAEKRSQELLNGPCHIIANPRYEDLDSLKKNERLKIVSQAGLNVFYLAFNIHREPFNKLEVRQAFNHALNKQKYIQEGFKGFAQVAKNPIPPSLWGFNKSIQDYDYNIEKAKQLLVKAGYPKGFKSTLNFMSESRPYNPNGLKIAELMRDDLQKIGVQVELVTHPWATYLQKAREREFDLLQLGWTGDNGDPDNFLNVMLSCAGVQGQTNHAGWCHRRFSFLVGRARVTTNIVQRTRFYEEAQVIFKKEAPWVTIAHTTVFRAMKNNVYGFRMSPLGVDNLYSVDLK